MESNMGFIPCPQCSRLHNYVLPHYCTFNGKSVIIADLMKESGIGQDKVYSTAGKHGKS